MNLKAVALALGLLGAGGLAAQPEAPRPCAGVPADWLALLNGWRAQARPCGEGSHPAPALRADDRLQAGAQALAAAMAGADTLSHRDAKQQELGQRLLGLGYAPRHAGEAVAAGQDSFDEVLRSWQGSAEHCAIAADARFRDAGLACWQQPGSRFGRYWVLQAGTARR